MTDPLHSWRDDPRAATVGMIRAASGGETPSMHADAAAWNRGFSFRGAEVNALREDLKAARLDHERAVAAASQAIEQRDAARHEAAWLKSSLAWDRARIRAQALRSETVENLAALRLQEILRLRREREEIRIDRSVVNELREAMKPIPTPRDPDAADCAGGDAALYGVGYTCGKCGARGRLVEGTDGRKRIAHQRTGGDARKAEEQRPPLGAMPDYIWREQRCQELADAIARHDFNREPDLVGAWAEELYDHIAWIQEHRQ